MKTEHHNGRGPGAAISSGQPEASAIDGRRILVVDDDAGLRNLMAALLRQAGHLVSCAEDGEEAWEALCSERFDAMITDHEMPRLTGLELLRRVRAAPHKMPVILISGRMPVGETDLPQLLSPGLALQKPFSLADFRARVRSILTTNEDSIERDAEQSRRGLAVIGAGSPSLLLPRW